MIMKNLLKTNERGHNEAMWRYFVKGTPRRRAWYARKIGATLGERLARRERLAGEQSERRLDFEITPAAGFRVFAPGTFADIDAVTRAANDVIAAKDHGNNDNAGVKAFLHEDLLAPDRLSLDSPFLRFALREDVIAAVSAYLGVVPVLQKIDVWQSENTPAKLRASQLYHCDWDDTAQIKVFIYCTDVDRASGPLGLIEAAASQRLRAQIGYTYDRKGYRVDDASAEAMTTADERHTITGPAQTTVFADTSRCFHYGSRVEPGGAPRIVAFYQFVTPTSFLFPRAGYPGVAPYRGLAGAGSSELQRLTLGAD